jgi:hypothetical protein
MPLGLAGCGSRDLLRDTARTWIVPAYAPPRADSAYRADVVPAATKQSRFRRRRHRRALLLPDKGSRASAGAHAHRAVNPDRPARRQTHRTGAIATTSPPCTAPTASSKRSR